MLGATRVHKHVSHTEALVVASFSIRHLVRVVYRVAIRSSAKLSKPHSLSNFIFRNHRARTCKTTQKVWQGEVRRRLGIWDWNTGEGRGRPADRRIENFGTVVSPLSFVTSCLCLVKYRSICALKDRSIWLRHPEPQHTSRSRRQL